MKAIGRWICLLLVLVLMIVQLPLAMITWFLALLSDNGPREAWRGTWVQVVMSFVTWYGWARG